ncbi:hypothetical protein [Deinococcus frigens]|uniref:hypothetical protein n=1 Tax=Deinococcus frigens TaxID=249403 RepID=UPI0012EC2A06|nr:hypothetical protein [Deinococcus frigens]
MKVRRPARVDPVIWERLSKGIRLALASHYARTPQRAAALRAAAAHHVTAQLEKALRVLEGTEEGVKHDR